MEKLIPMDLPDAKWSGGKLLIIRRKMALTKKQKKLPMALQKAILKKTKTN